MTTTTTQRDHQRPSSGLSLRTRLIASYGFVIAIALLLVLVISAVYLRRYEVSVEQDRLEEFSKTLTISTNYIARQDLLARTSDLVTAVDALATQAGLRLILLSRVGEVLYDSDSTSSLTGTRLPEFADAATQLIVETTDRTTIAQQWLHPTADSQFAGKFLLLSSGGPGRQNRALLLVAPERRYPLLARYLPRIVFVAVLSLAAASLVGYLLSGRIAAPIRRLTLAADAMASGNLEQAVPNSSNDELGRLVDSFNQMSRQVASTSRSQRELLANVAHDLRTPLTSIQGYAQALRDDVVESADERQRALAIIGTEAHRMTTLIGQILELSRLESGQIAIANRPVAVKALIDRVFERFQSAATQKGIALESLSSPGIAIAGDEGRLVQCLSNLLDNAIRHTGPGGTIQIQAHHAPAPDPHSNARIRLTVADTGEGIAPDQLPHLFERFNRGETQKADGFGLGLPIVREIIGLHRGTIAVSSQLGIGTTWLIELPAAPVGS